MEEKKQETKEEPKEEAVKSTLRNPYTGELTTNPEEIEIYKETKKTIGKEIKK